MEIRTRISAYLPNGTFSDENVEGFKIQIHALEQFINQAQQVSVNFKQWYVVAEDQGMPPLKTLIPSEHGTSKLLQMKKKDPFEIFSLWNGMEQQPLDPFTKHTFLSFFDKLFQLDILDSRWIENLDLYVDLVKVILNIFPTEYLFIKPDDLFKEQVFEHRYPCSSIVFIPSKLEKNDLPMVDEIISIHTEKNTGSLIILDKNNYFNQHKNIDDKVKRFAVALVDLNLLPAFDT